MRDLLIADPQMRASMVDNFDEGKMRGMLQAVGGIHLKVAQERKQIAKQQEALETQITKQLANHKVVQKALGAQVTASNRGYAALLTEHQNLQSSQQELKALIESMRHEHQEQLKEQEKAQRAERMESQTRICALERQVGGLEVERGTLKSSLLMYEKEIGDVKNTWQSHTATAEKGYVEMCNEVQRMKDLITSERDNAMEVTLKMEAEIKAKEANILHKTDIISERESEIEEHKAEMERLRRQCAELQTQDGDPEEDSRRRVNEAVAVKEVGYQKLVEDFLIMQKKNHEEMAKMREQYGIIVKSLEGQVKEAGDSSKKKALYLEQQLTTKETQVKEARAQLADLREQADNDQNRVEQELAVALEELKVAKEVLNRLNVTEKRKGEEAAKCGNEVAKEERIATMRAFRLEKDMDKYAKEAEKLLASKDDEINVQMKQNARLQKQIARESDKLAEQERIWDGRFREKERAMDEVLGDVHAAEQQAARERQVCESLRDEIKSTQNQFVVLDKAYRKQIAARMYVEKKLQEEKDVLAAEIVVEIAKQDEIRQEYEVTLAKEREEKEKMREEFEADIVELKGLIEKKDIAIKKTSEELITVREQMEEAEREADTKIKSLSRQIQAIQAEMAFAAEMAEEKYQRLLKQFERLQAKYDAEMADGGAQELKSKLSLLKAEITSLNNKIQELNEVIDKLHADIRERDFEIEETKRETADLLFKKEVAYREICAQVPPLEKQIEEEKKKYAEFVTAKEQEIKMLHKSCVVKLKEKDKIIKSMEFNDREDLVAQIAKWRQKVGEEKSKIEDVELRHARLLEQQQEASQVVVGENTALRLELEAEKKLLPAALVKHEKEVAVLNVKYDLDIAAKVEEVKGLVDEIEDMKFKFSEQMDEANKEPAYVQEYRDTIATQKHEIAAALDGRKLIADESAKFKELHAEASAEIIRVTDDLSQKLTQSQRKLENMESKYDEFKKIMTEELATAEATCREMENQLRNLPNNFEEEVLELKEKLIRMSALFDASKLEIAELKTVAEEERRAASAEKQALEEKVALANMVLTEVEGLKGIQSLAEAERFLGVDLDGDGEIG